MKLLLTPKFGTDPIEIDVAQFVLFLDNGAPALVAGEYGPPGAVKLAKATDDDFNTVLTAFGYKPITVIHTGTKAPPSGAELVGGPGIKRRY